MTRHNVEVSPGVTLEIIADAPQGSTGAFLVCHPHPEHGGTMTHPLIAAVADILVDHGHTAVRFNFRGVGASTGSHGHGPAEIDDITAVVGWMQDNVAPLAGITGWSFGAATALAWQARERSTIPYVGIAPPVDSALTPPLPDPAALMPARRTFIVGDRDQFVDATELEQYADSIGATTVRYETADHFFIFRHDRLATDVLDALLQADS
ncbi:MAG: alpha/beta hydrolase [Acidimicrobiia bacterium]